MGNNLLPRMFRSIIHYCDAGVIEANVIAGGNGYKKIIRVFCESITKYIDIHDVKNINYKFLCYVLIGSLNKVKEIVKNEKKKRKNTF
jgi:hypothetical protein